jgi:hypothetical protein
MVTKKKGKARFNSSLGPWALVANLFLMWVGEDQTVSNSKVGYVMVWYGMVRYKTSRKRGQGRRKNAVLLCDGGTEYHSLLLPEMQELCQDVGDEEGKCSNR